MLLFWLSLTPASAWYFFLKHAWRARRWSSCSLEIPSGCGQVRSGLLILRAAVLVQPNASISMVLFSKARLEGKALEQLLAGDPKWLWSTTLKNKCGLCQVVVVNTLEK